MKISLDNCCFNRPFDDQSQLRIRLEAEAKLGIQEGVRSGNYQLVWSYILDYENSLNPFQERREQIVKWRLYSIEDVQEKPEILEDAEMLRKHGIKGMDALHLACALRAKADFFLTTDDGVLKKAANIIGIKISDPIGFIKEATK